MHAPQQYGHDHVTKCALHGAFTPCLHLVYIYTYVPIHTSNAYAEVVYDLNIMQLITSPNHIAGNILDMMLTMISVKTLTFILIFHLAFPQITI